MPQNSVSQMPAGLGEVGDIAWVTAEPIAVQTGEVRAASDDFVSIRAGQTPLVDQAWAGVFSPSADHWSDHAIGRSIRRFAPKPRGAVHLGIVGAFLGDWLLPRFHVHFGGGVMGLIVRCAIGAIVVVACPSRVRSEPVGRRSLTEPASTKSVNGRPCTARRTSTAILARAS